MSRDYQNSDEFFREEKRDYHDGKDAILVMKCDHPRIMLVTNPTTDYPPPHLWCPDCGRKFPA